MYKYFTIKSEKNPLILVKNPKKYTQKNHMFSSELTMEKQKNVIYLENRIVLREIAMRKKLLTYIFCVMCFSICTGCEENSSYVEQGMKQVEETSYAQALETFETAKEKKEDERKIYRGMGIAYMGLARYEEAIDSFLQALDCSNGIPDSMDYDINYYLAASYYKNRQMKECEATYTSIIDLNNRDAIAYELRGKVRLEMGRYDSAKEDFDRAVELESKDYDMLLEIYSVLDSEGYGEIGKIYLTTALEEGKWSMTDTQKGMTYYFMGEYEKARQVLEDSKKGSKQDATYTMYLGMTYEKLGDYNYACSLYNNYLLTKEDATLYNQLGMCKLSMGEYEEALAAFQAGLALTDCPCIQKLKFNEIVAYEYLGDFQKASVLMDSYILTYPDDEEAKREQEFLKTR